MNDELKKHQEADQDDPSGKLDPLGENESGETLDIDEALKSTGLEPVAPPGEQEQAPINSDLAIKRDEKSEWES